MATSKAAKDHVDSKPVSARRAKAQPAQDPARARRRQARHPPAAKYHQGWAPTTQSRAQRPTNSGARAIPKEGIGSRCRELKLTNLDKVLFPPTTVREDRLQGELIASSDGSSRLCCPPRRATLNSSFPNGVGGPSFCKENTSTAPASCGAGRRPRDARKANTHLVAEEGAALCWRGNQAAFEVHAWTGDARCRPPRVRPRRHRSGRGDTGTRRQLARLLGRRSSTRRPRLPEATESAASRRAADRPDGHVHDKSAGWRLLRAIGAMGPTSCRGSGECRAQGRTARLTQNTFIKTRVARSCSAGAMRGCVGQILGELDDHSLRSNWSDPYVVDRVATLGTVRGAHRRPELTKL